MSVSEITEKVPKMEFWMEEKLEGMDLIVNETDVESTHKLQEFLALSPSPSTANDSSIISISDTSAESTSSPSSFESSFTQTIPKSSPVVTETLDTLSLNVPDKPLELVDCPEQNDDGKQSEVEAVVDVPQQNTVCHSEVKLIKSKLPTPSEKLKNCSSFDRSPVKDSQLEYLKLFRDIDTSAITPSSQTEPQSLSSGSSNRNRTYVISDGSSEERVTETLNTSGTSETSSVSSTMSTEASNASKKSKLPRIGSGPVVGNSKLVKPTTKSSLLPSKASKRLPKTSKNFLRVPARKTATAPPVNKPVRPPTANRRASLLSNQENAGVASISSNPPARVTRPPSKTRTRKSSIPKPVAVSKLRKSLSSNALGELNSTKELQSQPWSTVMQSTPIKATLTRKRPLPTDLTATGASFSSSEGSAATENSSVVTGETPKTQTKRRSLLPKPMAPNGKVSLGSPNLPKKSLKPRVLPEKGKQLPKPRHVFKGTALKPRNRLAVGGKQDGPVKPVARSTYNLDELEMGGPGGGGSKLVHSPLNKETEPSPPRSKWSPIKKKKDYDSADASIMCTKRTVK